MDHAISYLIEYMQYDKGNFIEEWKTGNYKKISDCPSYDSVKAYSESINILSKYHYNNNNYVSTPNQIIQEETDI